MQFSEDHRTWRAIPEWVRFLVRLGFGWPNIGPTTRRLALISMPCDSAAAGLVALGAMRRRLELDGANDLGSHFQRIESLALRAGSDTFLRWRNEPRRRYVLDGKDDEGMVWAKRVSSTRLTRRTINRRTAVEWAIDGEAPVSGARLLYGQHYAELVEGAGLSVANLALSDSAICLAGRVTGEINTQEVLARVRFETKGSVANLAQLLTLHACSPGTVSRVSFFNARTGQMDRATISRLVVADGDTSFLKVIDESDFEQSDIIGVFQRVVERDRLEELGSKLASLDQWYAFDTESIGCLPPSPRGIAVSILRQRRG